LIESALAWIKGKEEFCRSGCHQNPQCLNAQGGGRLFESYWTRFLFGLTVGLLGRTQHFLLDIVRSILRDGRNPNQAPRKDF
jgi:hypothetical protein